MQEADELRVLEAKKKEEELHPPVVMNPDVATKDNAFKDSPLAHNVVVGGGNPNAKVPVQESALPLGHGPIRQTVNLPGGERVTGPALTPGIDIPAVEKRFEPIPQVAPGPFPVRFAVVDPVLLSTSPTAMAKKSISFTLVINGAGFNPDSRVHWNGSPRETHFVSVNQLTAIILHSDLAEIGAMEIRVSNRGPEPDECKLSESVFFSVQ